MQLATCANQDPLEPTTGMTMCIVLGCLVTGDCWNQYTLQNNRFCILMYVPVVLVADTNILFDKYHVHHRAKNFEAHITKAKEFMFSFIVHIYMFWTVYKGDWTFFSLSAVYICKCLG